MRVLQLILCAALLGGCAMRSPGPAAADHDPIEGVNRKIFWFNDEVERHVLEPAASGWRWVTPAPVRRSVGNFFTNLRFPIVTVNDVLQGKLRDGASDVARFGVNTTVGVLGFFDPATGWGLPFHDEDFGQTLGRWGVPPGPYLMLPLLGPSNPRDAAGLGVDYVLGVVPFFVNQYILLGARVADTVNYTAIHLDELRTTRESALDYYTFVRNAYYQRRKAQVEDNAEMLPEQEQDLYTIQPER